LEATSEHLVKAVSVTNGIEKPVGLGFKTIKVNFNDLNTSIGLNFVEPDRILITPQFLDFAGSVVAMRSRNWGLYLAYNFAAHTYSTTINHSSCCCNLDFVKSSQVLSCTSVQILLVTVRGIHFVLTFIFKYLLGSKLLKFYQLFSLL
jgi:hypothetical protein